MPATLLFTTANLRARIAQREMLFGLFLDLGSPLSSELCAIAGYDWLLLDLEHGAATEDQLLIHLHAIQSTGTAALVRRQSGERMRIGRALDAGADGIMVPRLEDSIAAAEAVSFLPYPPDGVRGVAMRTRGAGLGRLGHADVRSLNETITGIIQVESPGAVRDADAIAALPGVDVLFVGPTDLSHSLGVPGRFDHPAYRAALAAVVAACAEHGKAPGILLYDLSSIAVHRELGFRFIGIGADGALVAQGARAALATVGRPPSG